MGRTNSKQLHSLKMYLLVMKWYLNFSNIDVNHNSSFRRKKSALHSQVFVVTEPSVPWHFKTNVQSLGITGHINLLLPTNWV